MDRVSERLFSERTKGKEGIERLLNGGNFTEHSNSKGFQGFQTDNGVGRKSVWKSALARTEKFYSMLTRKEIEHLIYNTVDIVPQSTDSVFLGLFSLVDNVETLNRVLSKVTAYYDNLLSTLPLSLSERLALQVQRPFTLEEYKALFAITQERHFANHAIFRTLLITTRAEQLLFTNNPNRDGSYKSYVALLQKWSEVHNKTINSLIHGFYD